jgi:sec-independent protein translocase protein TatA
MPFDVGAPELIIILVIIMLLFGVGKLPEVGGAIGKGIREFRKASREDESPAPAESPAPRLTAAAEWGCAACGATNPAPDGFCGACGAAKASAIPAQLERAEV